MALTNAFYEAVQSGNVRRVGIMMQDSLLVDPTFTEFNAMEKAASSMAGLYDEHDGKELIEDRNLWNDDYMDKVMVKILSNFSHERIDHLKEVVRYLRPVAKTVVPKKEPTSHQTHNTTQKGSYEEEKRIKAEKRKLEKEEERLLASIESLEAELADYQEKLALPEVYSDGQKAKEMQEKIESTQEKIQETSVLWEKIAEQLENFD